METKKYRLSSQKGKIKMKWESWSENDTDEKILKYPNYKSTQF